MTLRPSLILFERRITVQEVMVKTHLIITDIHSEYHMKWCGKILDAKPLFNECGYPTFVIIGGEGRVVVNTTNMKHLEEVAKKMTRPKGRTAVSTDKAFIYIKEVNGNEKLLGVLVHNRIKTFAPMFDPVGFRQ